MRRLLLILLVACHPTPRPPVPVKPLSRAAYAQYLTGKMAMYQHDWGAATVALAAARAAAPDEPMIVVELARAQAKAKDPAGARLTLESARRMWPDHPEIWVVSGDLLAETALPDAALAYRRAIALAPDDERGYLGLAKVEPANAEKTLRTLVKRVPTSVDGHYRLAVRLAKRDEMTVAIVELRAVLERDPDHIDARLDLARALRRQGHLDEAIVQTRSAFDRAAQPLDVAEELFWLLVEVDDRTGAIDLLTLLDDDRSDIDALATIARLDRGLGLLASARAVADKIVRQDADAGAIAIAEVERASGDPAAALARLAAVPDKSEHAASARKLAAEILIGTGEPAKAAELLGPVRKAHPQDYEIAVVLAFALADTGAKAEARATLASLGNTPDAQFVRARLADRMGDRAGALAILAPLIAAHPEAAGPLNLSGYLLVEAGRLPEGERQLRRARDLSPGDPSILDSWGLLLLRKGSLDDAIRTLARANRYAPREPEILVHLAEAWLAHHAPQTARELLERAAALQPSIAVKRRIESVRQALPAAR